jgi:hypothetical protein
VAPALQGHTPDIALGFDPELARECLDRSGYEGELELAGLAPLDDHWDEILGVSSSRRAARTTEDSQTRSSTS